MYGLISLIGIGIGLANDAISRNQKYYGTDRELFRNNPRVQKQQKGTNRLMIDIQNLREDFLILSARSLRLTRSVVIENSAGATAD